MHVRMPVRVLLCSSHPCQNNKDTGQSCPTYAQHDVYTLTHSTTVLYLFVCPTGKGHTCVVVHLPYLILWLAAVGCGDPMLLQALQQQDPLQAVAQSWADR